MSTTKTTAKPTPRHGTRARYRLEIKKQPDGNKGTACDRCKAANSKAAAAARANRGAARNRAGLHIVDSPVDQPVADTPVVTPPATDPPPPSPGPMELAIQQDIDEIPTNLRVPMHRSLSVLAIETARDFDNGETATARSQARRELSDLISKLRTRREGDGDTAVDAYLEELGSGPPRLS